MVIRMRMILSETRTTSNTFSHHFSASIIPTPPVPLPFPDQKSLKRESLPTICFTPSLFHLVSWRQHRSTLLHDTVSTTSLDFLCIVPNTEGLWAFAGFATRARPCSSKPPSRQAGDTTDYSLEHRLSFFLYFDLS